MRVTDPSERNSECLGSSSPSPKCRHVHTNIHIFALQPQGVQRLHPNLVNLWLETSSIGSRSKGFSEELYDQIYNLEHFRKKTANERNNEVAEPTRITKGIAGDHKGKVSRGTIARVRERLL